MFKITSLNSASVILKIGIGLISSKVIAVFVGPSGLALVGNLRNFISSLETVSTMGFQNGVVKYVAENKEQPEKLKELLSTVFVSLAVMALLVSGLLFLMSDYLNGLIFGSSFQYGFVIKALAVAFPWYTCSVIFSAIINGLGRFKEVIYTTIFGNIIGLIVSVILIVNYQTFGALLAIIISPSLLFFASWYYLSKQLQLSQQFSFAHFSALKFRKLASFSLMALVASIISPLVFLAIRKQVIATVGIEQAGHWEAMLRISTYCLLFVTTLLTLYFLPKLSVAKSDLETRTVLRSYYKNIVPFFVIGVTTLFFLREIIIRVLFTKAFLPVADLFFWQFLGDVLKVLALILGYNLVAKKKTTFYIIAEFISMITMYFGSILLVATYGIEGVVMAHCITYAIYLLVLCVYFRKSL